MLTPRHWCGLLALPFFLTLFDRYLAIRRARTYLTHAPPMLSFIFAGATAFLGATGAVRYRSLCASG